MHFFETVSSVSTISTYDLPYVGTHDTHVGHSTVVLIESLS